MRKIVLITLFPAIAFIWIIGWTLYYTGLQRKEAEPAKRTENRKKSNLEIFTVLDDERLTIKD
jgi:hypothetical protein